MYISDCDCIEFPNKWCNAIILPIHKKGSFNDPNNYRAIALLSCISKIFTQILNDRLVKWANNTEQMYEIQASFTKGKSTVDHIFCTPMYCQQIFIE